MALVDNLISYWKLDEASGGALDAHGTNPLADSNTVGAATGKINGCRSFVYASSESLWIADNAGLSAGDVDFTIAGWMKINGTGGSMNAVAKNTASHGEYYLGFTAGSTAFKFEVYGGPGFADPLFVIAGTPSAGTWYHVVAWHDSVNNVIGISVNGGTAVTAARTTGVHDGAGAFYLGGDALGNFWDGQIDEVGFWKRVLTSQERTDLYNGGAGLPYSSFSGGGNSPPATPTISAGTPSSSGVTLTSSAFSDTDGGDTHTASQWQVTTSGDTTYASPVVTTGDDATNKTSYAATGLTASTAYIARVRHKDSAGNYSSWSSNASFTTSSGVTPLSAGTASFVASGPAGIEVGATAPSNGSGAGPTYQWERNSDGGSYANLSGKTSLDLFDDTAVADILYGYRCKQTRGSETVTTNAITSMLYDGGLITGGGGLSLEDLQAELNTRGLTSANMTKVATLTFNGSNVNAFVADYDAALENATVPTADENATAVRTNLATELGRIDANITSRMATFTYTVPPTAVAIRTEIDTNSTKLDVAVSTRLPTTGYTAPITPPTAVSIRQEMDSNSTKLSNLDVSVGSRASSATALTNATWTDAKAAFLDASVSSRAPASTALSNSMWTDTKAGFLDAAISSRATAGGITQEEIDAIAAGVVASIGDQQTDSPGVTTLLTRLTDARGTKLDFLDAAMTSRMATFTYTAPPTTGAIASAVDSALSDDVTSIIAAIATRAPSGTALSNVDWTAARAAKLDNLDASVSSRSTYAGGAVTVSDKTGFKLAADGLDSIGQTMTGVPDTFVKKLLWVFHEKWRATRNKSTGVKTVYGSNGSVATTQATTDTDTQQTISAGT